MADEDLHSLINEYVLCTSKCGFDHMDDVELYAECKSKCARDDNYFSQFSKNSEDDFQK